jgi:hypothetical protein
VTKLTSLAEYYRRSYGDTVQIDLDAEIKYYKEVLLPSVKAYDGLCDVSVQTVHEHARSCWTVHDICF